jgi:hypothetical protein
LSGDYHIHLLTAVAEVVALLMGLSSVIVINIGVRIIVCILFYPYGFSKKNNEF